MKATATIVWLAALGLRCAAAAIPTWREWRPVAADVSALSAFSPQSVRVATAVLCIAHASKLDAPANAACYRHHECWVANADTQLALDDSSDWSCYQSPVCLSGTGELFKFLPLVKVPPCETIPYQGTCILAGSRYQLISSSAPKLLDECAEPFAQHEFGCIFVETERSVSACGARLACNAIGGELASPKSTENLIKLAEWMMETYGSTEKQFWMGVFFQNGDWRRLNDGLKVAPTYDVWVEGDRKEKEESDDSKCARFKVENGKYLLADQNCDSDYTFVCQVFM